MKKIWGKILRMLPPVGFIVMTLCIYMPSALFLGNIDEFAVDYVDVLPIILVVSVAVAIALIIIGIILANNMLFKIYLALLFGVGLACYVQGNFLNPDFGVFNGNAIDWSKYSGSNIVSIIAWAICLILPVVFIIIKEKLSKEIIKWASLFISAMQLVALVTVIIGTSRSIRTDMVLTKDAEFEISKDKNTIVFVVDTLDAKWADDICLKDEKISNMLKDFTYFNDAVSGGAPTILGIPYMFTGKEYDTNGTLGDYYRNAYAQTSLFADMKAQGYDVELYTSNSYLTGCDYSTISNAKACSYEIADYIDFGKYLYKLVAFYASPMPVKDKFWFYTGDMSVYVKATGVGDNMYTFDDALLYKDFAVTGVAATKQNKAFKFYHMFGAHGPYTMNENCEAVESDKTSLQQQIKGCFKMIDEYINQLKNLGLYDSSTIVITADHGGVALYQNPAIFVKMPNAKQEIMLTNEDAVTFENLYNTLAKSTGCADYGKTLFEMKGVKNTRYHIAPSDVGVQVYPNDKYVSDRMYTKYSIDGKANSLSNVQIVYE